MNRLRGEDGLILTYVATGDGITGSRSRGSNKTKRAPRFDRNALDNCRRAAQALREKLEGELYSDTDRPALLVPVWLGELAVHR